MIKRPVLVALAAVAALALASVPSAMAATPPGASTSKARDVLAQSATLAGVVNPHGSITSYFFQYGRTKHYGNTTGNSSAGSGKKAVPVQASVTGLRPNTTYHFRLVAFSPAGTTRGKDVTFKTPKLPVVITFGALQNPTPFGALVTLAGHVANAPAGTPIQLQQLVFPYTAPGGFANVLAPIVTDASGNFSFFNLVVPQATEFRVVETTGQKAVSQIYLEQVAVDVTIHGTAKRLAHGGAIVKFFGSVTPAHDGALFAIQRLSKGRWVTVRGGSLHHKSSASSKYTLRVRVRHSGRYRAFVAINDGNHVSGASPGIHVDLRHKKKKK